MELVSIYCRVSDSSQNDSIQNQLATIDSYCKQHNYIYDTPFIDSGKSGTGFTQRKAFLQLLKLEGIEWVKKYECFTLNKKVVPKYNKIICKSSSRFGRNLDCIKVLQLLTRQEVQVIFIEDGQEVTNMLDPTTNLVSSLNAVVNANFSIQNSQRVKNGMLAGGKAGNILTSNSIYGYNYNKNTKQLEIIEEQAEIIRWIFCAYIDGLGYKRISNILKEQGVKTKRKKDFQPELISYIIQNEKYAGMNVRNKFKKSKIQGDTRAKLNDRNDWIITNNIPPIISIDTFNRANEIRLSKKGDNRGKFRGVAPLSGKIICQKCGHHYNLNYYYNSNQDKIYYYICWGKKFRHKTFCDNKNLYVDTIYKLIDSTFINTLAFKNRQLRLNSISTKISELNNKVRNNTKEEQERLIGLVNALNSKKSKLLDLLINNQINQHDFDFKNNLLDKELAQLKQQEQELKGGAEEKLYKLKEVYNRIKKISINKTYTREEINNLIQQIKVLDNQLIVTIVINGITFTEELHY